MGNQDVAVGESGDDAVQSSTALSIDDDYTVMGAFGAWRHSGWRFPGITIPSGQQIDTAHITWTARDNDTGEMAGTMYGDDEAAPGVFDESDADDITTRPKTDAAVVCGSVEMGTWGLGSAYNSPSLASIVSELYASYDYGSGAAMALVWIYASGNGERLPVSWDANPLTAPVLHITYSEAAGTSVPVADAFNQVVYASEPPTASAWNQVKRAAGSGWVELEYE